MAGRVLVIDDEASIRMACEKVLTGAGYEVEVAQDGQEGVEKLAGGVFDVALVDLKMPGLDGMEVLRRGLEIDPHLVAIVITGYPSYESVVEAIKAGAYDYIPKPFSPDELRTVVGRGYEKRELERRNRLLEIERQRSLATIAEERGRLHTVVDCMADGVLVTDSEGRLALYNPAAARWITPRAGASGASSALGQPLGEVCSWSQLETLAREAATDRKHQSVSMDLPRDPGSARGPSTFMATAAPVLNDAGEVLGSVIVLRDVSEWRQLERTRSNFMATVCHEIRAPLSAIAGYLDLLLQGLVTDETARLQVLDRCRARAEGLVALTQDMLALSRLEATVRHLERIPIAEVMEEAVSTQALAAERARVTVRLLPPERELAATVDRYELGRIVGNLLSNAIKFNRPGGSVSVSWQAAGDFLQLEVTDTGVGIAPQYMDRLGEEFFRVRDESTSGIPGTGLGLAIVRNLVRSYHGDMRIESKPEVGTTVRVTLACSPTPLG